MISQATPMLELTYLAASSDGARRLAAGVERVLALVVLRLVRGGEDAGADVRPRAVVHRLLLHRRKTGQQ